MAEATLKMLLLGEDRGAGRAIKGVGDDAEKTHLKLSGLTSGFADVGEKMSGVMTMAGMAGPAVMAVGAAMSSAAAGAVALGGAIGPAAAAGAAVYAGSLLAVKSASLVTKFAMEGVAAAAGGSKDAMKKLTPEGQAFAKTLMDLKPKLDKIRSSVQKGLFPGLQDATSRLANAYLPLLSVAAKQTGSQLGLLATQGGKLMSSGPWRKDFATVTAANSRNLGFMGAAGLSLADAARSLLVTSMPLTQMFLKWAAGAASSVDQFIQAKRASGELAAFWKRAGEAGATLGHILGNIGVALGNVFSIGGGGQGKAMLTNLEGMSAQFRAWTTSSAGIKAISTWFAEGRTNLEAMGRLLSVVTIGLSSMGSGKQLAPLVDQITKQIIPPLMEFLHNASASGALEALVTAVGQVVQVFANLSASDGSLKAFAKTLGILASSAIWITQNVPGASKVLAAFFTILGASAALKMVGLGGVVSTLGSALLALATRFGVATGAVSAETGALSINTLAHSLSRSTAATWLGVKALEFAAWVRSTGAAVANGVAIAASTVAMGIARGASAAWTAAQWLLNAALTANPIGIVVVAVAALVAGLIYAYKHSETFRKIVDGAFKAVAKAASWMWNSVIKPVFAFMIKAWLTVAGAIVDGAAKAFGWVPGIGPKLKAAAKWFDGFRDDVNSKLAGVKDRNVKVSASVNGLADVDQLIQHLAHVKDKSIRVTAGTRSTGIGAYTTTARSVGGPAWAGQAYKINERGPETFVPSVNGRIMTAAQSAKGGGGDTYVFNIDGAKSPQLTARAIEEALAKEKRQRGGQPLAFERAAR